jgi:hypothetical protein
MEYYGQKEFATKKEMFDFLIENKDLLIAQKKSALKTVDCGIIIEPVIVREKGSANKAEGDQMPEDKFTELKAVVIINTTNLMDSHCDVHFPGIWNKSLKENKMIMHLQEHEREFEKVISDGKELKAYTKTYTWSELGYNYEGTTEALVFESTVLKKRNEFMFNQYLNGWVKNHSVGMYYVRMDMAVNDKDYPNEFTAWEKYYPMIANKEKADEKGFFWYVLEAKCMEGSAVVLGSNTATPTLSTETKEDAPPEGTHQKIEPEVISTQKAINYEFLIKNLKSK